MLESTFEENVTKQIDKLWIILILQHLTYFLVMLK